MTRAWCCHLEFLDIRSSSNDKQKKLFTMPGLLLPSGQLQILHFGTTLVVLQHHKLDSKLLSDDKARSSGDE